MRKLFNKISSSYKGINKVVSLCITLGVEEDSFVGGVYSIKNGEVSFENEINKSNQKEVFSKLPVIVTLRGKGVLNKFVNTPSDKIKLRNLVPNIKEEEFFLNSVPNQQGTWVGLVRKEVLKRVLAKYNIATNQVIDLHLDSVNLQYLKELGQELPTQLDGFLYHFEQNDLVSIKKVDIEDPKSASFFGAELETQFYSSMISVIVSLSGLNFTNRFHGWVKNSKEQKDKKVYYSTVKLVLGVLLFIFMGNMVVNQLLKGEHNKKVAESIKFQSLNNKAESLKEQVEIKKSFIEDLALESNPQYAFYADEIGKTIPQKIQLIQLDFNPLLKGIRKKKMISFANGVIEIGGQCKSSKICNEWIGRLRAIGWVKKTEFKEFKFNEDNIGEFKVLINY